MILWNDMVMNIMFSACVPQICSKNILLKRGHAHLPYTLLLLGNQLWGEICPHCNRIQNSK